MKRTLLVATLTLTALTTRAQSYGEEAFTLQPKVGILSARISNTPDLDIFDNAGRGRAVMKRDFFPGVQVGLEAEYQVNDWLGLAAGLQYSLQGAAWKNRSSIIDDQQVFVHDTKTALGYVQLPIVANFYVMEGLALKTGVQLGFLTNARSEAQMDVTTKDRATNTTTTFHFSDKDTSTEDFKKFEVAIPVGISYEFDSHFVLDMRYTFGLTRVNKDEEPGFKNNFNQSLAISFGYKFEL